jgi:hypothetical protein
MRQEYQPEMKSCPTNIGLVPFCDTVVLTALTGKVDFPSFRQRNLRVPRARKEKMLSSAQLLDG